jgi:hypothetical protein
LRRGNARNNHQNAQEYALNSAGIPLRIWHIFGLPTPVPAACMQDYAGFFVWRTQESGKLDTRPKSLVYVHLRHGYTKNQTALHPPILSYKMLQIDCGQLWTVRTVTADCCTVAVDFCAVNAADCG